MRHDIKIKNTSVAYWKYGDGGPVFVYVHGFRGTHHGLQLVVNELPMFCHIVPDLPGFGESESFTGEHSLEAYVDFVREFIATLALPEPPILVGHSFGSIVASHYVAAYPHTIQKLILINPISAPALEGPKKLFTKLAQSYYNIGAYLPPRMSRPWLGWAPIIKVTSVMMTVTKDPKIRHYAHDQHKQHFSQFQHPRVVKEAFKASVSYTVRDTAAQITLPTLLIAAEKDQLTTVADQKITAARFKDARLVILPSVGHLIHYEAPVQAASAIREFIS